MSTALPLFDDGGPDDGPLYERLELRPLQSATLQKVREAWLAGATNVLVQAPCGFGKCHGIDTPILMADGTVKAVQDVRVGDRLLGPDGRARNVLALGRGREPLYRVVPVKGDPYTCNESHILCLRKTGPDGMFLGFGTRVERSDDVVAVSLREFIASNATARTNLKGWRSAAVEFPDAERTTLPVPPYVLGAWLGDGRLGHPYLSKPPCNLTAAWVEWCEQLGCTVTVDTSNGTRCPTFRASCGRSGGRANPCTEALRAAGVAEHKHVPHAYKTASVSDRLELLAGLLDSDGHYVTRGGFDWISVSRELAHDLAFLARSLGFACYVTECQKGIASADFTGTYWRCSISGDLERIPCRDKPANPRRQIKRHLVHGITVEPIGEGDYFGFQIDGDHLYLLGDFTVCHNTELATGMLQAVHEKGKRGAFLCDRLQLVQQTSQRFDKYGLPHGIIQADNPRYRPDELIQVCSVDTLAARGRHVDADLLFVDECHIMRKTTKALLKSRGSRAVGLTATPTTRGLGKYFDAMVTAATTNQLIREGLLVPFRVYAPSEPDMTGVKVTKMGEWDEQETEKRVLEVVGDCVAEYVKLGEGRKFIGFARTKAHAAALQRSFAEAGIVTALYTDDQGDDERRLTVEEFRKPDSYIRGLWSVEALTRGFDVADVSLAIFARPLRKGFHVHIQMLGRVLRTAPGKVDAIVLDHAGNTVRFWDEQCEYLEHGWPELDDGRREKEKKKPEKKERQPVKCSKCSHVHPPAPACPSCGFEYPRRNDTHHAPGELSEFGSNTPTASHEDRQTLYSQLLWVGDQYGHKVGAAAYRFKEKTGRWPDGLSKDRAPAPPELERWVLSRLIAFNRGKKS